MICDLLDLEYQYFVEDERQSMYYEYEYSVCISGTKTPPPSFVALSHMFVYPIYDHM